ncbi:MAG TPA: gliding motility protein GldC [Bacteroidia bacterium]|jgi:gliding motility-associated protein GldC|nr:gliding motility protein GldC [Bacteroidia bacterium]
MTKKTEINIAIELDENNLPISMNWTSSDNKQQGACKAMFLSLWDEKEKNSMHLHLWTKEMLVDEMKQFTHQVLLAQSDTIKKAVGEEKLAASLYDFAHEFALQAGILKNIE